MQNITVSESFCFEAFSGLTKISSCSLLKWILCHKVWYNCSNHICTEVQLRQMCNSHNQGLQNCWQCFVLATHLIQYLLLTSSSSTSGCFYPCREFLWSFRLPGEAQKIDRMMEAFAKRYCDQNPEMFTSTGELNTKDKLSYNHCI